MTSDTIHPACLHDLVVSGALNPNTHSHRITTAILPIVLIQEGQMSGPGEVCTLSTG